MLITNEYRALNAKLHEDRPDYGTSGRKYAQDISAFRTWLAGQTKRQARTITMLDYGCGKQTLKPHFPEIVGYDPCISGLDLAPASADLVVCTDVMEHVEPELIDNVLDHIERLADVGVFFVIHTGPAVKTLADGRNAHLTQEGTNFWLPKLDARWQTRSAVWWAYELTYYGEANW